MGVKRLACSPAYHCRYRERGTSGASFEPFGLERYYAADERLVGHFQKPSSTSPNHYRQTAVPQYNQFDEKRQAAGEYGSGRRLLAPKRYNVKLATLWE